MKTNTLFVSCIQSIINKAGLEYQLSVRRQIIVGEGEKVDEKQVSSDTRANFETFSE